MNKPRQKGYRTVASGRKLLEDKGYLVANLEKTGKFVKEKDLFSLWDCLAVKGQEHIFIQFKTNLPIGKKSSRKWLSPYIEFGKAHGSDLVKYQVWVKYDRKGFKIVDCVGV